MLVLMHSGKDTGLSGMFNPAGGSYGGTAVMERNLTRLTVAVSIAFVINTMLLGISAQPRLIRSRWCAGRLRSPALVAELVDAQG